MVPSKQALNVQIEFIVKRLNSIGADKKYIIAFMKAPLIDSNDGSALDYIYLGLGHIVLNVIDNRVEKYNGTKS